MRSKMKRTLKADSARHVPRSVGTDLPFRCSFRLRVRMLAGSNAIHPDRLTVEERLSDVAEILAHGLRRHMACGPFRFRCPRCGDAVGFGPGAAAIDRRSKRSLRGEVFADQLDPRHGRRSLCSIAVLVDPLWRDFAYKFRGFWIRVALPPPRDRVRLPTFSEVRSFRCGRNETIMQAIRSLTPTGMP